MSKKFYQRTKVYRLIDQLVTIKTKFPESHVFIKNGILHWDGFLRPSAVSRVYHVTVEYKMKRRPIVKLIGDNIQGLNKPNFPHKFQINYDKQTVNLCLHLAHEFNSGMLIADTIIPWAIEWLYFYEIWLATGTWRGGGKHPDVKK